MDLTTTYMGLSLRSPLTPSASPLMEDVANIKRMEDHGAGAVVLHSLFEEQLTRDKFELNYHLEQGSDSFAEALSYFPEPEDFKLGPDEYLNHIQKAKDSVQIPVIASLNGSSLGGWTDYAKNMQQAGADALELNIYYIPTDPQLESHAVEQTYVDILKAVKSAVTIPVAVKLSPFFSNVSSIAKKLSDAGADGLVLFNRFYQPDIDLEALEVKPHVLLSTPQAMRLPLRWIAILYGRTNSCLAATGGVHTHEDALKMIMAGANITMLCSALLRNGIGHLKTVGDNMVKWMEEHEYVSVKQMLGSMSQQKYADPSAFERAQYMKALKTYVVNKV